MMMDDETKPEGKYVVSRRGEILLLQRHYHPFLEKWEQLYQRFVSENNCVRSPYHGRFMELVTGFSHRIMKPHALFSLHSEDEKTLYGVLPTGILAGSPYGDRTGKSSALSPYYEMADYSCHLYIQPEYVAEMLAGISSFKPIIISDVCPNYPGDEECTSYWTSNSFSLPATVDEYLASLPYGTRRDLKKLKDMRIEVIPNDKSFTECGASPDLCERYTEYLFKRSVHENASIYDDPKLYRALMHYQYHKIHRVAPDSVVRIAVFDNAGKIVAANVALQREDGWMIDLKGFREIDKENEKRGLGIMTTFATIKEAIKRGCTNYDLCYGEYDYKTRLIPESEPERRIPQYCAAGTLVDFLNVESDFGFPLSFPVITYDEVSPREIATRIAKTPKELRR